jgi:hypothetical protein
MMAVEIRNGLKIAGQPVYETYDVIDTKPRYVAIHALTPEVADEINVPYPLAPADIFVEVANVSSLVTISAITASGVTPTVSSPSSATLESVYKQRT